MNPSPGTIGKTAYRLANSIDLLLADLAHQAPVPPSLRDSEQRVREALGDPADLRALVLRPGSGQAMLVLFLQGLVDDTLLHEVVLTPLLEQRRGRREPRLPGTRVDRIGRVAEALLAGRAVVQPAGARSAWVIDVRGFEHRRPSEPDIEPSIRGPREGLIEVLDVNIASIRRRLATAHLRFERMELGALSRTRLAILHVAGRADPLLVADVRRRLVAVPWDTVITSQQIQERLEERVWSLFPQVRHTERPDVCVAALTEGRVVVLLDGAPLALIVPMTFWDLLQSPDDYHLRWPFGAVLRFVRLAALMLMLAVLPVYISVVTIHPELVPTNFFLSVAAAREGLPFPTLVEALIMSFLFDLLREASTRLPKQIGGALTIVGALVIGEAAVRGGFVSAPMVILIGLSALSAFVLPAFDTTIPFRILSYVLVLLAGTLGLVGVAFGLFLIVLHMASLTSFGVPYLSPFAPFRPQGWEDTLVRAPWYWQQGPPAFVTRPPGQGERGRPRAQRSGR